MTAPKVTLIYDNGLGDITEVSLQSRDILSRINLEDWFYSTALQGIGFEKGGEKE